MKYILTAAALCIGMFGAQAQNAPAKPVNTLTPVATTPAHPAHNCMMASDKDWASLKLTAAQTGRVKAIQAACMKDCGARMKTDPKMSAMMDKHEAEVKTVLTADQYTQWMKWCAAQVQKPEIKPVAEPALKPTEKVPTEK